jgi:hypothetical protein
VNELEFGSSVSRKQLRFRDTLLLHDTENLFVQFESKNTHLKFFIIAKLCNLIFDPVRLDHIVFL